VRAYKAPTNTDPFGFAGSSEPVAAGPDTAGFYAADMVKLVGYIEAYHSGALG